MSYYHSRTTTLPFDEAVARVREAQRQGRKEPPE